MKERNKQLSYCLFCVSTILVALRNYGDTGLVLAVLKGNVKNVEIMYKDQVEATDDTLIGNKTTIVPYSDEIILRTSAQVLPMAKYSESLMNGKSFQDILWSFHKKIQRKILDPFFNASERQKVPLVRVTPNTSASELIYLGVANAGSPNPKYASRTRHNHRSSPTVTFGSSTPRTGSSRSGFQFGYSSSYQAKAPPSNTHSTTNASSFGSKPAPTGQASAFSFGRSAFSAARARPPTPPRPASQPKRHVTLFGSPIPTNLVASSSMNFGTRTSQNQVNPTSSGISFSFGTSTSFQNQVNPTSSGSPFSFGTGATQNQGSTFRRSQSASSSGGFQFGTVPVAPASASQNVTSSGGFRFGSPPVSAASSGGFQFGSPRVSAVSGVFGFGSAISVPTPAHPASQNTAPSGGFRFGPAPVAPIPGLAQRGSQNPPSSVGFRFGSPPAAPVQGSRQAPPVAATLNVPVPQNLFSAVVYNAPLTLQNSAIADSFRVVLPCAENCSICLCGMSDQHQVIIELKGCKHKFHRQCIEACFLRTTNCPVCRKPIGDPQGLGPSGSMTITVCQADCSGFAGQGSIKITYSIYSGVQAQYHTNPGVSYSGTTRIAYLPNNLDGQHLLKRLKFAFAHGLTFSIGTSQTSGAQNVVIWGSIHHKTSRSGGGAAHGFPDSNYFVNCNGELDALGVPAGNSL